MSSNPRTLGLLALILASQLPAATAQQGSPQQQRARQHREMLAAKGIRISRAEPVETDAVEVRRDVVYATYGDRQLHADLFLPRDRPTQTAAVVVVHGGGWLKGDKESFHAMAQALALCGYVTATIEYRLGGEARFPAAVHDCNAAVRWLRAHATELRVDPNRIAAVGGSAGGHLVGLMATAPDIPQLQGDGGNPNQSSRIQAAVVMAGPMQMTTGSVADRSRQAPEGSNANQWIGKTIDEAPELYALAAPFQHLSRSTPPILFLAGELDQPQRNLPTRNRLRELGVPTAVRTYRYGRHACWNLHPWFRPMINDIDVFLRQVLGDPGGPYVPIALDQSRRVLAGPDQVTVAPGEDGSYELPRLNNPIGQVQAEGSEAANKLVPGVTTWELRVPPAAVGKAVQVDTIGRPWLPIIPRIVSSDEVERITLAAHDAVTHGTLLRFEPQPHKNTVGYWANIDDWVEWHFYCEAPGTWDVHVLQGCGKGHGGSEVTIRVGDQQVPFTVEDTGHFQNFRDRQVGTLSLPKPGVYTLSIKASKKPGVAVMDVRQVRLERRRP